MVAPLTVVGIFLSAVFFVFIIIVVILIFTTREALIACENDQSPFCLTIQCPCAQNGATNVCKGYAQRPGPQPNTFYCSYAPNTLVDINGNPT